ncbi:MAG: hypothetical protein K8I02_10070, partial [Candidatus Methylomirabilis sp.]|nr:hypothetical protein [Deltaproteobacteria bacterium]
YRPRGGGAQGPGAVIAADDFACSSTGAMRAIAVIASEGPAPTRRVRFIATRFSHERRAPESEIEGSRPVARLAAGA